MVKYRTDVPLRQKPPTTPQQTFLQLEREYKTERSILERMEKQEEQLGGYETTLQGLVESGEERGGKVYLKPRQYREYQRTRAEYEQTYGEYETTHEFYREFYRKKHGQYPEEELETHRELRPEAERYTWEQRRKQRERLETYRELRGPVETYIWQLAQPKMQGSEYPIQFYPVAGAVDVEARIKEETGIKPPTWRETSATGWLYAREPTGLAAGYFGTLLESKVRPEIPTAFGAGFEFLTVRGHPATELYPSYTQPTKKDMMISGITEFETTPYTAPPRDPFKELLELGPGYVTGSLLAEATEIYLWYKALGWVEKKLAPKPPKTVEWPEVSREMPRPVYGLESYGIPQVGGSGPQAVPQVGGYYRPEFAKELTLKWTPPKIAPSGTKTPLSRTFQADRQFLVQQMEPTAQATQLRTLTAKFEWVKRLVSEDATKTVSKLGIPRVDVATTAKTSLAKTFLEPSSKMAEAALWPLVKTLPKAWQTEPFPGTKVKVREEYETVVYQEPKTITEHITSADLKASRDLRSFVTPVTEQAIMPKMDVRAMSILETRLETEQITEQRQITKQIQRQMIKQVEQVQRQMQSQTRTLRPRYVQIGRRKPMAPRLDFEWPKRRPRGLRERFLGGWFLREYPIRSPMEMLGLSKPRKSKRRRRKRKR